MRQHKDDIEFKTQNRQKTLQNKNLVFQKSLQKMQTYINLFEQKSD